MQDFLKYGIYSLNMDFDAQKMHFGNTIEVKNKNKQKMATKKNDKNECCMEKKPWGSTTFFMLNLTQQFCWHFNIYQHKKYLI